MPTNDERREVAARLRNLTRGDELRRVNPEVLGLAVMHGICPDLTVTKTNDALLKLADLIEPERTCHKELMIWFFPATGLTPQREVEYFGCSKCGEWLSDTDCYGLDDGPFYCSNCGCEVDPSFVTDEVTGEVIYRDGAKVVSE